MKIDLHVHTCHSRRPAIWLLQKLGCPESFTDPLYCYHELKRMGMGKITFTDHNSIEGCLAVAHLPDTFISEEITTYFPEDRCKIHVLAYNISEDDHVIIQKKRDNLYKLIDCLRDRNIPHAIAHPFSAVNDKFTRRHFEKVLLLFNTFEINGDQTRPVNHLLRQVLGTLTPEELHVLSRRHGITVFGNEAWCKRLVSGSDDHAGTRFADSYTQVEGIETMEEFFSSLENGAAAIHATSATELSFARDIYSVAYQFIKCRFGLERYSGSDVLLRFCDSMLQPRSPKNYGILSRIGYALNSLRQSKRSDAEMSPTEFIRGQAERLIQRTPELRGFLDIPADSVGSEEVWFNFVDRVTNLTLADLAGSFLKRLRCGQYFDLFHLLGSAGTLYLLLAPYLVSFAFCSAERRLAKRIVLKFRPEATESLPKVACLTDTFHERNGVANALRRQLAHAMKTGRHMRVIAALDRGGEYLGVHSFPPAYLWESPGNGDLRLRFPAILSFLKHICYEGYSCLQAATIGPAGLAALLIGRLLGLPVLATYHSGLFEYLRIVTEDRFVSDLAWRYMSWFFNQCDLVQAVSEQALEELATHGVTRSRLRLRPRGADYASTFDLHWQQVRELIECHHFSASDETANGDPEEKAFHMGMTDELEFLFRPDAAMDWLRQPAGVS